MDIRYRDLPAHTRNHQPDGTPTPDAVADLLDQMASSLADRDEPGVVTAAAHALATLDLLHEDVDANNLFADYDDIAVDVPGLRQHAEAGEPVDTVIDEHEDTIKVLADELRYHEHPRFGVIAVTVVDICTDLRASGI
ncbi:hypothetical protein DVS28_b0030 (plasmid) [Euzebya pacifica]|uniref:Uncharacterized protein n=1 Tax=Euzebya pacifica TaxID=1608957 RepID=A0A346Y5Q3_9ACTN|nr:hypothetical protein [Euzebya pacifica]AXV09800.1 hypothetical protein DVS28_b0030 [Euzebya pacifica]